MSLNLGLVTVTYLHQVGANRCDEWCVVLYHRRKTHSQFSLAESCTLEHHVRLLTPGNKEAVVFHFSYNIIDLRHWIPAKDEEQIAISSECAHRAAHWCKWSGIVIFFSKSLKKTGVVAHQNGVDKKEKEGKEERRKGRYRQKANNLITEKEQ